MNDDKIHYFIAGEGGMKNTLQLIAEKLKIGNQLHLLGFRLDVDQLLRIMDVYCLPSIREGLNVSLMEAMASGLLCVVSRIRGNVDLIEDGVTGCLCNPYDVEDVTNALLTVLELQKKSIFNGRSIVVENYSSNTVNGIMRDLYKRYM